MNIAICYHGMTRSTKYVYETHYENIFHILKQNCATYDIFMHTWKTKDHFIWEEKSNISNDYTEYQLLNPSYYQIDDQDKFLDSISFENYYYEHDKDQEWLPQLLRNHICALESQKRCFEMCQNTKKKYDYVIFIRPDVFLLDTIPYNQIFTEENKSKNIIWIPNNNWFKGYNDRFAITSFDHASWYGTRINQIVDYRKNHGRIVAEEYVKYIIDKYYELRPIPFSMLTVRPNGTYVEPV